MATGLHVNIGRIVGDLRSIRLLILVAADGPLKAATIQRRLSWNPVQLKRVIDTLRPDLWIVPTTSPSATGPILVEWTLTKRGQALVDVWNAFRDALLARRHALGQEVIDGFDAAYGRIGR